MNTPLPMKSSITAENVARYVVEQIVLDSDLEKKLRLETSKLDAGGMISGSDVGSLLGILTQLVGGKKALEIGTFTGYTALKIASALSNGGILICCDVSSEWTSIGRKYWQEAGLSEKIDLRIAPALQTLESLLKSGEENTFDFVFIDADKTGYDAYYEASLKLIRPGGLIVLDNMLWDGAVADPKIQDETTLALRNLNAKISQDHRVHSCLMTIGDGLMLARKK
jgi:predicted O-methyltransferase YrrM